MLKIQVAYFVLGSMSFWIIREDRMAPDASEGPEECATLNPWAPDRNTEHHRRSS